MEKVSEFIDSYFDSLNKGLNELSREEIENVVDILLNAWKQEKQIFLIGNGGSASTASHFACDLGKGTLGRNYDDKKRFRVISLTDNVATLTAYGNDLSFEEVFAQQLRNLVSEGDVAIFITGSGNSENILKAIEVANTNKAVTIGFLGFDGGRARQMLDHYILFKDNHYGRVEDSHLILEHLICSIIREKIKDVK
ncbi:MAG: SIS domain-containing protein [Actinobacteria bacterium]|nr:SIS domain-containing protein [Actinomycetota bacterium]